MAKYQNTYRIASTRLQHHDYTFAGAYFITICTKNKKNYFGEISNAEMTFTPIGGIAKDCWQSIPQHFPTAAIDSFVVMPNHVHGIIILSAPVETRHGASLNQDASQDEQGGRTFGPLQRNSISSIINAYKSSVTRICRKQGILDFAWQERFYDHVIRGEHSFHNIRRYINDNILQWGNDELNLDNTL